MAESGFSLWFKSLCPGGRVGGKMEMSLITQALLQAYVPALPLTRPWSMDMLYM